MSTSRPFAYNPSPNPIIPGTEQLGSLAIGTPTAGFAATGLEWWMGPNEDLGNVVAGPVPSDTQPTPVVGVTASVHFFRTPDFTDQALINLANYIADGIAGPFATATAAKSWLNANGYWTNYTNSATGGSINLAGISQLSVPSSADWTVGTGDFTIEWFHYQNNNGNENFIFDLGISKALAVSMASGGNKLNFYENGTKIANPTVSSTLNTWTHVAVSRAGGTTKLYFNGAQVASFIDTTNISTTATLYIGCEDPANPTGDNWPGNLTNFRFIKGTGLYTGPTLTVPTQPLTAVANTKLLLLASSSAGLLTDSSGTGKIVSNIGVATFSTLTPF